jgi:3-hydroxyisobutyrate dehydrogenase-like beta-hydroxyacid dehydrogenase
MEIAYLGLGNMGAGMAGRLLKAGHVVRVWNRSAEKMGALVEAGAVACSSPAEAVTGVPLVISCLMDDASIRSVFGGEDGVIVRMTPDAIHVCVTTISAVCGDWLAVEHAAHGSRYVSGPVLGRPDAAAAGTLLELLAGDKSAIEEVTPVLKAFANILVPMEGPAGVANSQKLCFNFFIASLVEVFAEVYTFAEKTGASKEIMAQFFQRAFAHPGLQGYASRMKDGVVEGEGGFSTRGGLKDVRLMLDAAEREGCPLDIAEVMEGKLAECVELGLGDADWSVVQRVTRERAGLLVG